MTARRPDADVADGRKVPKVADDVGVDERVDGGRWLDVVVSRTLLFVLMTAVIAAAFAVGFVVVGRQVLLENTAMGVLLGAFVAAVVQPVYRWGIRGVDWLLYGDRADPYKAIVRSGQAVQTHTGGTGLVEALVDYVWARCALAGRPVACGTDERPRSVQAIGRLQPLLGVDRGQSDLVLAWWARAIQNPAVTRQPGLPGSVCR
jgi:hypothetical protein